MSLRSFRNFFTGGSEHNEPSTSEEVGIGSHRVLQDFVPPEPKQLTAEELKKQPHRIFVFNRKRVFLERILAPSLLDVPRHRHPEAKGFNTENRQVIVAETHHAAWAYRWDLRPWRKEYNVTEVCIWELGEFVDDDDHDEPLEPVREQVKPNAQYQNGQLTPPNSEEQKQKLEAEGKKAKEIERYKSRMAWIERKPMKQHQLLNTETIAIMKHSSGGRLERLIAKINVLDYDTIYLADHCTWINRHTIMIFYFLSLIQSRVRNLRLEKIRAEEAVSLVDNIDLRNLDSLIITQAEKDQAWYEDTIPPVMMKWLQMPRDEKRNISFFFSNVHFNPLDIINFIKKWHLMPTPHLFNKIVFDEGIFTVHHLTECLENSEIWDGCFGHPTKDQAGFGRLDDYRINARKKEIIFYHCKGEAVIHYSYREGQYVFRCFPNKRLMMRQVLDARTWRHHIRAGNDPEGEGPYYTQDQVVMINKSLEKLQEKQTKKGDFLSKLLATIRE